MRAVSVLSAVCPTTSAGLSIPKILVSRPVLGNRLCPSTLQPKQFAQALASRRSNRLQPMASASQVAAPEEATASSSGRGLKYTSFEGNSWQATFTQSGVTVLVDPWLVEDLVFFGLPFFFRGSKGALNLDDKDVERIGQDCDIILISQNLDDHLHQPTLKRMPKDKPMVGSMAAAKTLRGMGFTDVHGLDHGQSVDLLGGRISVQATAGALVGPPWSKRENGYVLQETRPGGVRLYYEPHADFDRGSVRAVGQVDVVVTPAGSQLLGSYALVKGNENIVELLHMLGPKVVIPLINADFKQTGPLAKLIHAEGKPLELARKLEEASIDRTRAELPAAPGEARDIQL